MADRIIEISDDFWNIRGSFRIGGVVNIGTHASLVRLSTGRFVLLDSYALNGNVKRRVMEETNGGNDVEAILNLHPFHTVHCKRMHQDFPDAKLYGSSRHHAQAPGLPWEGILIDDPELHDLYADDFLFSVPQGVDFISKNSAIHFSSVLAYHRSSDTIHVDDTLMYVVVPFPLGVMNPFTGLSFHPTLAQALERRAGAASDFRGWADTLADEWGHANNLCAAHSATLVEEGMGSSPVGSRIKTALRRVAPILRVHELRFG